MNLIKNKMRNRLTSTLYESIRKEVSDNQPILYKLIKREFDDECYQEIERTLTFSDLLRIATNPEKRMAVAINLKDKVLGRHYEEKFVELLEKTFERETLQFYEETVEIGNRLDHEFHHAGVASETRQSMYRVAVNSYMSNVGNGMPNVIKDEILDSLVRIRILSEKLLLNQLKTFHKKEVDDKNFHLSQIRKFDKVIEAMDEDLGKNERVFCLEANEGYTKLVKHESEENVTASSYSEEMQALQSLLSLNVYDRIELIKKELNERIAIEEAKKERLRKMREEELEKEAKEKAEMEKILAKRREQRMKQGNEATGRINHSNSGGSSYYSSGITGTYHNNSMSPSRSPSDSKSLKLRFKK